MGKEVYHEGHEKEKKEIFTEEYNESFFVNFVVRSSLQIGIHRCHLWLEIRIEEEKRRPLPDAAGW